jgi:Na+-transporting NADH:ubiquinone oxidoreductase subunit C
MSEQKTPFMETPFYPILFMLVITVVFVGVLSAYYRSTEKKIEQYKQQTYQLQILSLFADTLSTLTGIDKATFNDRTKVQDNYNKYIHEMELPIVAGKTIAKKYFKAQTVADNILGYCFDVTGSGLWGTMHGLLAVTPDYKKIINFTIYDQMETPGLGARVEETWFKGQFAGKPLITDNAITKFTLVPEGAVSTDIQVRQITGASITSSSVLKIIEAAAEQLNQTFELKAQ